jgi:hypothetical protein
MPFGLADIDIAAHEKKEQTVTPAEGNRRQKKAVGRFSSACAWANQLSHYPSTIRKDTRKLL